MVLNPEHKGRQMTPVITCEQRERVVAWALFFCVTPTSPRKPDVFRLSENGSQTSNALTYQLWTSPATLPLPVHSLRFFLFWQLNFFS